MFGGTIFVDLYSEGGEFLLTPPSYQMTVMKYADFASFAIVATDGSRLAPNTRVLFAQQVFFVGTNDRRGLRSQMLLRSTLVQVVRVPFVALLAVFLCLFFIPC